jgi:lipopolysaccharide transport system ATP-binding protein
MPSTELAIEIKDVSKHYRLYDSKTDRLTEVFDPLRRARHHEFKALKALNLTVEKGEVLGIIGKNGSGKSTLLKIISGIIPPSSGAFKVNGTVVPLIELGTGFNPEFTGLENIYFYNSLHGLSSEETDAQLDKILDFSEIGSFIHQPLKLYSSGMMARLAFAVSININPDILILDEVLSVGDEMFRRKCFARMEAFFRGEKTVLFVSHSTQSINELCTRCVWLHEGELLLDGPPKLVTAMYGRMTNTSPDRLPLLLQEIREMNANEQLKREIYEEIHAHKTGHEAEMSQSPLSPRFDDKGRLPDLKEMVRVKAHLIPDLIPKSSVYERHRELEIREIQLKTLDGEKVNVLLSGEEYVCNFAIHFEESLRDVYFRIIFTNKAGVILGAMNTKKTGTLLSMTQADEEYAVQWRFRCNLLTGYYFISASVQSMVDDEVVTLAKYTDALAFSVIEPREMKQGGFVLMDLTSKVIRIK